MNEGKAREKIDRANNADALLRNEILQDAFVYLDTQFTEAWKQTPVQDKEARENLYLLSQNLSAIKNYIYRVVEDGKLAQSALDGLQLNRKFDKRNK